MRQFVLFNNIQNADIWISFLILDEFLGIRHTFINPYVSIFIDIRTERKRMEYEITRKNI